MSHPPHTVVKRHTLAKVLPPERLMSYSLFTISFQPEPTFFSQVPQ